MIPKKHYQKNAAPDPSLPRALTSFYVSFVIHINIRIPSEQEEIYLFVIMPFDKIIRR